MRPTALTAQSERKAECVPAAAVSEEELEAAGRVQRALLPQSFPAIPGFDLDGFSRPAGAVSGDFYDAVALGNDAALLVVADVMGRGMPAALFGSVLRGMIRAMAGCVRGPGQLLGEANRQLFKELDAVDMFITAQVVLVEPRRRRLTLAGAGHCPLLAADASGPVRAVVSEGLPLGIEPQSRFQETVLPLTPASCMMLCTDGVFEALNPSGQAFGWERLESWLQSAARGNLSASEMARKFLAELGQFEQTASTRDDQTLLIVAARPPRSGFFSSILRERPYALNCDSANVRGRDSRSDESIRSVCDLHRQDP